MNLAELDGKNKEELLIVAQEIGLENGLSALPKSEIVFRMMQTYAEQQGYILASGVLDLMKAMAFSDSPVSSPAPMTYTSLSPK